MICTARFGALLAFIVAVSLCAARASGEVQPLRIEAEPRVASNALSTLSVGPTQEEQFVVLHLEFENAAARAAMNIPGVTPLAVFDRFADVFVPVGSDPGDGGLVDQVLQTRGLVWCDTYEENLTPPPTRPYPADEQGRDKPEEIVRGGVKPPGGKTKLTGKGVIVAVLDTGIDFHHPDFIEYDEAGLPTSRILAFWDTQSDAYASGVGKPGPAKFPNGAPIGVVYSRDELSRDLRGGKQRVYTWDLNGHGTAAAGIACGNGAAAGGRYTGVAPNADIVVVNMANDTGQYMQGSYLMGAVCDWLEAIAGGRPIVILGSITSQKAGRDGATAFERQLDARYPKDRPGRILCFAAGNAGLIDLHADGVAAGEDDASELDWTAPRGAKVSIYLQTDNDSDLFVQPADASSIKSANSFVHPISGHVVIELEVRAGEQSLALYTGSGAEVEWDAYIDGSGAFFGPGCATAEKSIAWPGTAANALTVGSYDWNFQFHRHGRLTTLTPRDGASMQIGAASDYSSLGPRRGDELVKPELLAPGQWHTAPTPMNVDAALRDSTGAYCAFRGTSAALAYAAGVCALALEKNPELTSEQLKQALAETATRDTYTGDTPNETWGHGKLDRAAIERFLERIGE